MKIVINVAMVWNEQSVVWSQSNSQGHSDNESTYLPTKAPWSVK